MTLHEFNTLSREELRSALTKCCGSSKWVERMMPFVPAEDMVELFEDADQQWWSCDESDWKEAFAHHPRIGDLNSLREKFASTADWAGSEQSGVNNAQEEILKALSEGNKRYQEKFGYIFIVCATGKSAEEILGLLQLRLNHDPEEEMQIAAEEQSKITKLRIEKLLD
jgi:2-oxo-4-hydroxy-4-carboxy-5-ureidoimidazoline decarboxylase